MNELTLSEVERLASNAKHLSWIDFTGGEPTLRDDFADIVGCFIESCPSLMFVHFPSNGLFTQRVVKAVSDIARLKPRRFVVTISIDGPPDIHDGIRGVPGGFTRATRTYRELEGIPGVDIYIGMTLVKQNVNSVSQAVDALRQAIPNFSPGRMHVNIAHRSDHYYGNADELSAGGVDEIARAVGEFMAMKGHPSTAFDMVERLYQRRVRSYLENGLCPMKCAAVLASCFMSADGTVYPCSIWDAPLGNVREHGYSLKPLVRSQEAQRIRRCLIKKECPNCWTPCEAYPTIGSNLLRAFLR